MDTVEFKELENLLGTYKVQQITKQITDLAAVAFSEYLKKQGNDYFKKYQQLLKEATADGEHSYDRNDIKEFRQLLANGLEQLFTKNAEVLRRQLPKGTGTNGEFEKAVKASLAEILKYREGGKPFKELIQVNISVKQEPTRTPTLYEKEEEKKLFQTPKEEKPKRKRKTSKTNIKSEDISNKATEAVDNATQIVENVDEVVTKVEQAVEQVAEETTNAVEETTNAVKKVVRRRKKQVKGYEGEQTSLPLEYSNVPQEPYIVVPVTPKKRGRKRKGLSGTQTELDFDAQPEVSENPEDTVRNGTRITPGMSPSSTWGIVGTMSSSAFKRYRRNISVREKTGSPSPQFGAVDMSRNLGQIYRGGMFRPSMSYGDVLSNNATSTGSDNPLLTIAGGQHRTKVNKDNASDKKGSFKDNEENNKRKQRDQSFLSALFDGLHKIMGKNPLWDLLRWGFLLIGKNHPILAAIGLSLPLLLGPISGLVKMFAAVNTLLLPIKNLIPKVLSFAGIDDKPFMKGAATGSKGYLKAGAKTAGKFGSLARFGGKFLSWLGPLIDVGLDIPDIMAAHKSGRMTEQLSKTGGGIIGSALGGFLTAGNPLGIMAGNWLGRNIGEGLGPGLQSFVDSLQELDKAFAPLVRGIGNALSAIDQAIMKLISPIMKRLGDVFNFLDFQSRRVLTGIWNGVVGFVKGIGSFFGNIFGALSKVVDSVSSAVTNFVNFLKTIPGIKKLFEEKGKGAAEAPSTKQGDAYDRIETFKKINELKQKGWTDEKIKKETSYGNSLHDYRKYSREVLEKYQKETGKDPFSKDFGLSTDSIVAMQLQKDKGYAANYGAPVAEHLSTHRVNGVNAVAMKDLNLYGTIDGGNSKPYLAPESVEATKYLDNWLYQKGYGAVYTSAMGGHDIESGHGRGRKLDVQLFRNGKPAHLTADELNELQQLGYFGAGTGALGWEAHSDQVGGGHYDLLTARGGSAMLAELNNTKKATEAAAATATATANETANYTSINNSTALRQSFAERIYGKDNAMAKAREVVFSATDVTGSLGVWGITQVNNTGKMRT